MRATARLRAMCTRARMRMTATSCAASPTTWSLQPLCSTKRARSKIQRWLAAMRSAKCAIKAPHCASSPTPRARVRVRVRTPGAPFASPLVSASMKQ
ncbi:hypothetical protein Hanom_Chr02g00119021 [Helianthus anomalus]